MTEIYYQIKQRYRDGEKDKYYTKYSDIRDAAIEFIMNDFISFCTGENNIYIFGFKGNDNRVYKLKISKKIVVSGCDHICTLNQSIDWKQLCFICDEKKYIRADKVNNNSIIGYYSNDINLYIELDFDEIINKIKIIK